MPYYHNKRTGDTGYIDANNMQWELAPGGKNLPVQYRDFTPEQLAAASGHLGIMAGEFAASDPRWTGGVGNSPTYSFDQDPAVGYIVPRINGMNMLDYLQSKGRPTGVVAPQAAPQGNAAGASAIVDAVMNAAQGSQTGPLLDTYSRGFSPNNQDEITGRNIQATHPVALNARRLIADRMAKLAGSRITPITQSLVGSGAGGETQRILGLGGF